MKYLEGGSNAIKGFLFQFDRTILEILQNPDSYVAFEQEEDIQREKYYIQVKERSKSKYYPSAIRNAVEQLFDLFLKDETSKFCLYCHFKDKDRDNWRPRPSDLNEIFGTGNQRYEHKKVSAFCDNLVVEFSYDYEAEFKEVIRELKRAFSLNSTDVAVMYHAVIRTYLLDLAVKEIKERKASFSDIRSVVKTIHRRVSMDGYRELLGKEKYERLLHKMYFVHRRPNIDNFERLFIMECSGEDSNIEIMQLIMQIAKMYYVKNKSPQPFILLRNLDTHKLKNIKQGMIDKGFMFNDGTWFDGDKMRTDKLFASNIEEAYGKVKFLPSEKFLTGEKFLKHFDEIYDFYSHNPLRITRFSSKHIEIPIRSIAQTLKVLKS